MNILAELSIFPIDKGESVSKYVSRVIGIIEKNSIQFSVGPMGTCLEGDMGQIMNIIKECMYSLQEDCNRIYMTLKVDYRKGRVNAIQNKISSVERYLKK